MYINKDYALVFSGGGGKGAYQIGVWKALDELGVTPKIKAVAGSSVGALNALLFSRKDRFLATKIWEDITQDDMLYTKDLTKKELVDKALSTVDSQSNLGEHSNYIQKLIKCNILTPKFIPLLNIFKPILKSFCAYTDFDFTDLLELCELVIYSLKNGAMFSQYGLAKLIDEFFMLSSDQETIPSYATLSKAGSLRCFLSRSCGEYIQFDKMPLNEQKNIVLASSALPLVYPTRKIGDCEYYDGGWVDNVPIKAVYDKGYKNIIVIYLENNNHNKLNKDIEKENEDFYDANILRIIPNKNFKDDFLQTIAVSPELTEMRMATGYNDAIKQLKPKLNF